MKKAQSGFVASYSEDTPEFKLERPSRYGYTFIGWTWEGNNTPVLDVTIPTGSRGDKTYIANWRKD